MFIVSVITEIELLGWPGITGSQKVFFKNLINDWIVLLLIYLKTSRT
jgi:hypothetical protein